MSTGGTSPRSFRPRGPLAIIALVVLALALTATAEHYVMHLGSKSDPEAHLFSYDQKFRESTYLVNYELNMTARKEFTDATRLSTAMYLSAMPDWTEIVIDADFIGIGRIGYVVYDPETGETKQEASRISHLFVGNFSMDEHLKVAKDYPYASNYPDYLGFLGPPV